MNVNKYLIIFKLLLFSGCLCEISEGEKEKLLNGFLEHYNSLPNQIYQSNEGSLQSTQQVDDTTYEIVAKIKVKEIQNAEVTKSLTCAATVKDSDDHVAVTNSHCHEPRQEDSSQEVATEAQAEVAESVVERRPVQLDNEVQSDTAITSGEQFIAIPRDQPSVPCFGCATHVNPQAAGVSDLASLGLRHLDIHQPTMKHTLERVLDVERQVQVVNGVRYILTMSVHFDNCSDIQPENCVFSNICKITFLVKPWVKLPNGGNYRAILGNNCTEEWQYGDNGEVLPDTMDNQAQDKDRGSKGDDGDDIQVKYNSDVQSQPNMERTLTDEEMKNLEEQIIPNNQFQENYQRSFTVSPDTPGENKEHVFKVESNKHNVNTIPVTEQTLNINLDKKKAIDDLLNYFDFSGFKLKTESTVPASRARRSYDYDLQLLTLAEDYHGIKNSIKNARFVYGLAQTMVNYLNEIDMEVKNREIKSVIKAEEETDSLQRYIYVQASVTIPCDKVECEPRDMGTQICNGVLDATNDDSPQIISSFCYNDNKERDYRDIVKEIPLDDPVLQNLALEAVKKIESESNSENALKVNKIISALTQVTSGTLTKFSIIVDNLKCNKSVPQALRINCTVLEQLGSQICEIIVHERHWLKETKISYSCTDRPVDMKISKVKSITPSINVEDPKIIEMLQEAIQFLETQSEKNNKQKIVNVTSISSQIIAGFLTKIEFLVGYTNCTSGNELIDESNKCHLLKGQNLRLCKAQFWDRSWIIDGRQVEVSCDDVKRKKRSVDFVEGQRNENRSPENKYKKLANESLQKFMQSSLNHQHYEVVKVDKVDDQNLPDKLIRIQFSISPTNCKLKYGILSPTECHVINPENIIHCHSKILENVWVDKKQLFVNCNLKDYRQHKTSSGLHERDSNDSKYYSKNSDSLKQNLKDTNAMHIAVEALQAYLKKNPESLLLRVTLVDKVVIKGLTTKIVFLASHTEDDDGDTICYAEFFATNTSKGVTEVKCYSIGLPIKRTEVTDEDPNYYKYIQMADESLYIYLQKINSSQLYTVASIESVMVQWDEGIKTQINFIISPTDLENHENQGQLCRAEIREQPWIHKKNINVKCELERNLYRSKRQVHDENNVDGGLIDHDPNDPNYRVLAEESLLKFVADSGTTQPLKVVKVEKVTTQVVSGLLTRIDFVISGGQDINKCHSKIWEQPWLDRKDIDVSCHNGDQRSKREAITGGLADQDPNDAKYRVLAEESLLKFVADSGTTQPLKVVKVEKVTTQVVSGLLTRIDFVISGGQDINKCHSKIWEQPWMNRKDIDVSCHNGDQRSKREAITGGMADQDPNDAKYRLLAEESLLKFVADSGTTQPLKVVKVEKVTTQVVSGLLTRIDFVISGGQDINKCHSKIWEQSWMNRKDIDVSCHNGDQRSKREAIAGGLADQDPNDAKYRVLAEESLLKFAADSGTTQPLKVVKVEKVTTQVVSGLLTRIDFTISDGNANTMKCHSKIFEQVWVERKEVNVECVPVNIRARRDLGMPRGLVEQNFEKKSVPTSSSEKDLHNVRGDDEEEQNPNKPEYKLLVEESLRKFQQKSGVYHKVLEVKRVLTRVVSGLKYNIDFTAAPTACSVNESRVNARRCKTDDGVILYCHTEIWDRPWLRKKKIDVQCNDPSDDRDDFEENDSDVDVVKPENESNNSENHMKLANEATEKYLTASNRKYVHKVTAIQSVSEQQLDGTFTIDFTISPTTCLRNVTNKDSCKVKQPVVVFHCNAKIRNRPWGNNESEIEVTCKKASERVNNSKKDKRDVGVRSARQTVDDAEEMDEDIIYYYADRALQHVNDHSRSNNLHKLISIHAVQSSLQMGARTVKMYIEIAETYCLRHQRTKDLANCEELNGLSHRLCLARLWPAPDEELITRHVSVVCDDEEDFVAISGVNVPELLRLSMMELEKAAGVKYKLVHQGEPQVIPSLDSRQPFKINFVVAYTNCSVEVDLDKNPFQCYINHEIPSKSCHSFIWLKTDIKTISYINVKCTPLNRLRRSTNQTNLSSENEEIKSMVAAALEKLEMSSLHRYKQRVLQINSYSTKITSGKVTTIDFDVGYTSCLKYEWVENITSCDFLEHLPRRRCVAQIWERLWIKNGQNIDVNCVDDETPLESHIEFESAEMANALAREALKHIEAKYPHPSKQKVVRIFSLEKQVVAGIHYKMKIEVGFTDCVALSDQTDCKLIKDHGLNKFCRVNVWVRPWTDHPPNFRVSCDFQEGATHDLYHHVQAEQLFYSFLTTYSPSYVNDYSQMQKRFEIFKNNIKKIHEFNVHEKGTAIYGVTRFADLTYEEFSSIYMGLNTNLTNENQVPMKKADIPDIKIPEDFDWREHDAVTEVKDQGSCGSCWAFSVTGNIEGQWKMQSGQLISLSEQELVDCDKLDDGCNGGLPDNAYRAIEQMGGLELESDYPYEGVGEKCEFNKTLAKVQISGAVNITTNETGMAQWLVHNGPISIGINANAMQFYMGGISHPWKMLCNPTNLDHGVLIVGYGIKDYPLFHKKLPYWIIKNSWGKSWGEQGYYRVYRGDGTCGVNQMASSAII